ERCGGEAHACGGKQRQLDETEREERGAPVDRGQLREAPLERSCSERCGGKDADDRSALDRRVPPGGDHEQDGEEEHADKGAEQQAYAEVRRDAADERRLPAFFQNRRSANGEHGNEPERRERRL